jgi:hypothetical protein
LFDSSLPNFEIYVDYDFMYVLCYVALNTTIVAYIIWYFCKEDPKEPMDDKKIRNKLLRLGSF